MPEIRPITSLEEVPISERHGVWARWSEDWDYLYLTETSGSPAWQSCLYLEGQMVMRLPQSSPALCPQNHIVASGDILN
jgi:hypothetical protein